MGRIVSYRIVAVPGPSRNAKTRGGGGHASANARVSSSSRRRGEQRGEGIGVQRAAEVPGSRGARERLVRGCVQLAASVCDAKASQHNGDVVGSLHGDHPRAARRELTVATPRRRAARACSVPVSAASPRSGLGGGERLSKRCFARGTQSGTQRGSLTGNRGIVAAQVLPPGPARVRHLIPKTAAQSGRAPERHRRRPRRRRRKAEARARPTHLPAAGEAGEEGGFPLIRTGGGGGGGGIEPVARGGGGGAAAGGGVGTSAAGSARPAFSSSSAAADSRARRTPSSPRTSAGRRSSFSVSENESALSRKSLRRGARRALPRKRRQFSFYFRRRPAGPSSLGAPLAQDARRRRHARASSERRADAYASSESSDTTRCVATEKGTPRGSFLAPFAPARPSRRRKRRPRPRAGSASASAGKTRPPRGTRPRLLSLPSQVRNREKKPFLRCRCPPNDGVPRATARATSSTSLLYLLLPRASEPLTRREEALPGGRR